MYINETKEDEENIKEQVKDKVDEMIERHNWVPLNIHTLEGEEDE